MKLRDMSKQVVRRSLTVAIVLAIACAAPMGAWAQGALAPGAAHGPGEAPGGAALAPMPADNAQANSPSAERGMSFSAGGGQCRETVPGGTLLAVAYAVAIAVMGSYVVFLGWKNTQLSRSIDVLEAQLAKRTGADKTDDDA